MKSFFPKLLGFVSLFIIVSIIAFAIKVKDASAENEKNNDLYKFDSVRIDKANNKAEGNIIIPVISVTNGNKRYEPLLGLVKALKNYTDINMKIKEYFSLDSGKILKYPLAVFTTEEITENEKKNLYKYIRGGGFIITNKFVKKPWFQDSDNSISDSLQIKPIPLDHPLYHCFFDFKKSSGAESSDTFGTGYQGYTGFWDGEELVGIIDSAWQWKEINITEREMKMAVNIIVYAFTREKANLQSSSIYLSF